MATEEHATTPAPAATDPLLSAPDPDVIELFLPQTRPDPFPLYRRMRARGPIWETPAELWVATGFEACAAILRDGRFSTDQRNAVAYDFVRDPAVQELLDRRAQALLFMDPPAHTRIRSIVNKAFTPRVVDRLRPHIQEIADGLLGAAAARGEMELIRDFAYPLPVIVIAEMLGVPPEDRGLFEGWSHALAANLDPLRPPEQVEAAMEAADAFDAYFARLIEERRRAPRDDLLTALIAAEDSGDRLNEAELLALCTLLLIAGHETTANLIGNGLLALLRNPGQMALWRARPEIAPAAVEELLRYDGTVQLTGRSALDEVEVAGAVIRKGQAVLTLLAAANRDPERFEAPDALRLERGDSRHLAFGAGAHFCLGAPLARVEGAIALGALVQRFPGMALAGEPRWRETLVLRGLESLPLALEA